MSEEKKLDEKKLEEVTGGLSGEAIDNLYKGVEKLNSMLREVNEKREEQKDKN